MDGKPLPPGLARLVNPQRTAEGTNLPPVQRGANRVPNVTNLRVLKHDVYFGGTEFTISFAKPGSIPSEDIANYNVYATGHLNNVNMPQGPFTCQASPAVFRITSDQIRDITFRVQVVLKNGMSSNYDTSPTCTYRTVNPALSTGFVTGAASLTTQHAVVKVGAAPGSITQDISLMVYPTLLLIGKQIAIQFVPITVADSPYSVVTQPYSVILADASGGDIVITLSAAVTLPANTYWIKRVDSTIANTITVTAFAGDTIEGDTSLLLDPGDAVRITNDSTSAWYIT